MSEIAILLPDLRFGGAERVNLDLAYEFTRSGHSVELVLRRAQGELLDEARREFKVTSLGCDRVRQVPVALARYLRKRRPDGLIAALWPLTTLAPVIAKIASPKTHTLVAEHGMLSVQYESWGMVHRLAMHASTAMGYRLADALVGVSQGVADDMATLANLGRGRVSVIGNPVPPPREPSEEALRQVDSLWGVPRGSRILSVGRLKPVKNHALLLQALVHCKRPNARIMLVGSGECEAALRALTIRLGLNDRIIFAGFQPDPSPFYRTADVLAVSSNHEGFGNVIVEALACGVPVVSTDCPSGPSEILANGQFGFLVPVDHAKLMAEAFEHVLGQPKDPDRLKTRAGLYAPKYAAEQYLSLLNLR